ncbi:MAG TPA: sensor histidine kinase N-terminal domain-containing protein [Accumulibacter sp.]|nr:sensor histidine kinase N-terminal domain-containing protein [Accumulibacter sp.]
MPGTVTPTHSQSLRWRLLRAVFATALLVWGLNAILSYTQARHEAEELMDGHLAQAARLLLALVRDNESHLEDLATRLASVRSQEKHRYESPLEFQVGRADGSLLCGRHRRRQNRWPRRPATTTYPTPATPGES